MSLQHHQDPPDLSTGMDIDTPDDTGSLSVLLIIPTNSGDLTVFSGWSAKFNDNCQNPDLSLSKEDWVVTLRGPNFVKSTDGDIFNFGQTERFLSAGSIRDLISEGLRTPRLCDLSVEMMARFGDREGLSVVKWISKGNFEGRWTGDCDRKPCQDFETFVRHLSGDGEEVAVTLVHKTNSTLGRRHIIPWTCAIRDVVKRGIFPFYKYVNRNMGDQFTKYIENLSTILPHHHLMKIDNTNGSLQSSSHEGKAYFADMMEWEFYQSAAVIYDSQYLRRQTNEYITRGREISARITMRRNSYVEMALNLPNIHVVAGTTFHFRLWPSPNMAFRSQFTAISIESENTCPLLSFEVRLSTPGLLEGQEIKIELGIKANPLRNKPRLSAIQALALSNNSNEVKFLQSIMLGTALPKIYADAANPLDGTFKRDEQYIDSFAKYICKLGFTEKEKAVWVEVLDSPNPVTMFHGASPVRVMLLVSIAISFALCGHRSLIAVETTASCKEILDCAQTQLDVLGDINRSIGESFNIVYFPPAASFALIGAGIMSFQYPIPDLLIQEFVSSIGSAKDRATFNLWTHVFNRIWQKSTDAHECSDKRDEACSLLKTLHKLSGGLKVSRERSGIFFMAILEGANQVLSDPRTRVVLTTCKNSGTLRNLNYLPKVVILEGCETITEPDSCIPLALMPEYVVFSARCRHGKPAVRSSNGNVFASQLKLSLFERVCAAKTVRLMSLD